MSDNSTLELWKEVLKRALKDIKTGPDKKELDDYIYCTKKNAEDWIRSDVETPGSFIWVCELVSLEPTAVRREIFGRKT
jgi:hypothetical protein